MNATELQIVRTPSLLADAPHVPVLIVGAGACGMTAAIGLRERGIECVLVERDALPQGSTALSSGFIPAAGTRLQKSLGITDSRETFAQDVQAKAHGDAAPQLVEAYIRAVAQAIDALEQHHGIVFEVLDGFLYPGHRARRMHAVPEHTGAALMACLQRA
ncbi:MAG: FAD-dependent oxidoreductase, partial [Betaproteobacteria bacterium]